MKKRISFLLIIVLLLAGCAAPINDPGAEKSPATATQLTGQDKIVYDALAVALPSMANAEGYSLLDITYDGDDFDALKYLYVRLGASGAGEWHILWIREVNQDGIALDSPGAIVPSEDPGPQSKADQFALEDINRAISELWQARAAAQ